MLGFDENMQALRQLDGQVIIEEEPHAAFASDSSNSMASRISSGWTSYHLATSSSDEFALTLRARIWAGTPDLATVGWPKLRRGSITTCFPFPSGHQTMSLPENSSSFRKSCTIRENSRCCVTRFKRA